MSASGVGVLCVGIATLDHVYALAEMPRRATKYRATDFRAVGGGIAATAAVAVARLGGRAQLVTRLGDDSIGDAILGELAAYGVDCALSNRFAGRSSSISAVLIDAAGERLIVNYLDPALPLEAAWTPDIPPHTRVVLADTRWPRGAAAMLGKAKRAGALAILDGDAPGCDLEMLRAASLVAFSAECLADVAPAADVGASLARAEEICGASVLVTDGGRGAWWREAGALRHMPAFQVEAVDTLGAGDVFHGALALALGEGRSMDEAVRFASAAAAIKVSRFGGRAGAPTRAETDAFLARRTAGGWSREA